MVNPAWFPPSSPPSARHRPPANLCDFTPTAPSRPLDDPEKVIAGLRAAVTSGDLELTMSLQRIAEAAQALTAATGVAIAIRHHGPVVCLARAGETAPELGSSLDVESGISGECLRSGTVLRCRDTYEDPRVNMDVCRALHLRSLAIVPLLAERGAIGILEAFSNQPDSFPDHHLQLLKQLAELVAVARIRFAETESSMPRGTSAETQSASSRSALLTRAHDLLTPFPQRLRRLVAKVADGDETALLARLGAARLIRLGLTALAVVVIFVATRRPAFLGYSRPASLPEARAAATTNPAQSSTGSAISSVSSLSSSVSSPLSSVFQTGGAIRNNLKPSLASARTPQNVRRVEVAEDLVLRTADADTSSKSITTQSPPPTSTIAETADEIPPQEGDLLLASVPPTSSDPLGSVLPRDPVVPAATLPVSQGITEGIVEYRIQPTYPQQARAMRLEGQVVLRATVTENGALRDLKVVRGHPILARAAVDAVSRWRYRPYQLNGKAIAMQTNITLDFKLP
jgi:TonB family protein